MPTVEAHVRTTRAARYVSQLARHFTHQPGGMTVLSSTPDELLIDLGGATWTLRATQDSLVLRVQADDPTHLSAMSRRVGDRIEQLGHRDGLRVNWVDLG
ncbi:DUF2218 domain-containing protein [Kribbella sp. NPDC055071]